MFRARRARGRKSTTLTGSVSITLLVAFVGMFCLDALAKTPKIKPPRLLYFVKAELPADTPLLNVNITLMLTISTTGDVSEVTLKEGARQPWANAAAKAAKAFRFAPATSKGKGIAVQVPFTYRFRAPTRRGRLVAHRKPRRVIHPTPGLQHKGVLLEKGTRSPIAGVEISVTDPSNSKRWSAISDAEGKYILYGLPPGRLKLDIVTGEHEPISRKFRASQARPGTTTKDETKVYLDPVGLSQYKTVVKDKRKPLAADEIRLTDEEIRQTPGTFGDPTRVVATLPGVIRSPFGLGYYAVRGASFENTGFFIDGHPAFYLYHLLAGPGIIHPELIGDLIFYPGGYPVKYGRFAAGAIVLETADPPSDRWHLDLEADLLKASALYSTPFDGDKGQITASVRRSYYELLLPAFQTDDNKFSLSYTDYQLRLRYRFSPTLATRLFLLGSEDSTSQSGASEEGGESTEASFSLGLHRLLLAADLKLAKDLVFTNSMIFEYDHIDNRRSSSDDPTVEANIEAFVTQLRSFVTWTPSPNFNVESGLDTLYVIGTSKLRVPTLPPLGDPRPPTFNPIVVDTPLDAELFSIAPYFAADWEVLDDLRVIPGVRTTMDYYAKKTHYTIDPKLAVRYRVHPQWTIKTQVGIAHQPPPDFQTQEPYGDPDMPPVRSSQGSLGFEWEPGHGWEVHAEGYIQVLDNMGRPNTSFESDGDDDELNRSLWKSDMRGRGYGAEFLIRKRVGGRFHGWLSYTISRSERLRPPGDWELYEVDQTHILNLAWSVKLGADWSLGARFTLTSGNPYYRITGSRYDADRDKYEPIYAKKRSRQEPFHRLDLRLDKQWRFDTWILAAYLDIINAYNASNPETQRYSYDFSEQTPGPGIPILPTIGLRASF